MYELSDKEFEAVLSLNADYREAHFKQKFKESGELYILLLNDGSGPFFFENEPEAEDVEGSQELPVWCHPRYAEKFAALWDLDAKPQSVSRTVFLEKWVPSLAENTVWIAYMPTGTDEDEYTAAMPDDLLDEDPEGTKE